MKLKLNHQAFMDWFSDEDHVAITTGSVWVISAIIFVVGLHVSSWPLMVFGGTLSCVSSRLINHWRDWFPSTAITKSSNVEREDAEADAMFSLVMDRLTAEESKFLEDRGVPVLIIHDERPITKSGARIYGNYTDNPYGQSTIKVFSANMRAQQSERPISTETFELWMYRIVLHEIAHAHGITHKQMCEEFNL